MRPFFIFSAVLCRGAHARANPTGLTYIHAHLCSFLHRAIIPLSPDACQSVGVCLCAGFVARRLYQVCYLASSYVSTWAWIALVETVSFVVADTGNEYVRMSHAVRLFAKHPFTMLSKEQKDGLFRAQKAPTATAAFKFKFVFYLLDSISLARMHRQATYASKGAMMDVEKGDVGEPPVQVLEAPACEAAAGLLDFSDEREFNFATGIFEPSSHGRHLQRPGPAKGRGFLAVAQGGDSRGLVPMAGVLQWLLMSRWVRKIDRVRRQWMWHLQLWRVCLRQLPVLTWVCKSIEGFWWERIVPRVLSWPRLGASIRRYYGWRGDED